MAGAGRGPRGFTLIEVVVALVILTVALGALLQLFQTGLRSGGVAETRVYATLLAQSRLAALGVEAPLEPGEIGGEIDERFRWSARIEPYHDAGTAAAGDEPAGSLASGRPVDECVHSSSFGRGDFRANTLGTPAFH